MKHAFLFAAALVVLPIPALIENKGWKATAETSQYSEWKEIPPEEIVVNLFDLKGIRVAQTQSRMQNNAVVNQRSQLLRGFIDIQHTPANVFNIPASDTIRDADLLKGQFHRLVDPPGLSFELKESRQLYAFNERGGWLHSFEATTGGSTCFIGRTGFLSEPGKNWDAGERYDTFMLLLDCSGERSIDQTEAWLRGMSIVSPGYNRQKMTQ